MRLWLTVFMVSVSCFCFAQKDSFEIKLPAFLVVDSSTMEHKFGAEIIRPDSLFLGQSLNQTLEFNSSAFVTHYGPGMISSINLRGSTGEHNKFFWNGIPVNNTATGVMDFSTIQTDLIDVVSIDKGINSLSNVSGAFGGAIQMNSDLSKPSMSCISFGLGSFNTQLFNAKTFYRGSDLKFGFNTYLKTSQNDYPYWNTITKPYALKHLENASFGTRGMSMNIQKTLSKHWNLSYHGFHNHSFREIPSPILQSNHQENQLDISNRMALKLSRLGKYRQVFSMAYSQDKLLYSNLLLYSPSSLQLTSTFFTYNFKLKTERLSLGYFMRYQFQGVQSSNYAKAIYASIAQSAIDIKYNFISKIHLKLGLLGDYRENEAFFVIPSSGVVYENTDIKVYAMVSTNTNRPSFNQLYWSRGGNPFLKNEKAVMLNFGFIKSGIHKNASWKISTDFYHHNISNKIAWLPVQDVQLADSLNLIVGLDWLPINIGKVESSGMENNIELSVKQAKFDWLGSFSYVLNRSINIKQTEEEVVRLKLLYMPLHQIKVNSVFRFSWLTMGIHYHFVDKRYTDQNNDFFLRPYQICDVSLSKKITLPIRDLSMDLSFRVSNLFNEVYHSIAWRPMPMRSFQLQINIKWQ